MRDWVGTKNLGNGKQDRSVLLVIHFFVFVPPQSPRGGGGGAAWPPAEGGVEVEAGNKSGAVRALHKITEGLQHTILESLSSSFESSAAWSRIKCSFTCLALLLDSSKLVCARGGDRDTEIV